MPDFPPSLTYEQLRKTSEDFDSAKLQRYGDLYEGGDRFRKRIEQYLDRRQIEKGAGKASAKNLSNEEVTVPSTGGASELGAKMWEARKQVSRYTNYVAGQIDQIISSIFTVEPRFQGPSEYWQDLNRNADGRGTDLAALARRLAVDAMVCGRPFLSLRGPKVNPRTALEAKQLGVKDLRLDVLKTEMIDDWEFDGLAFNWIRTFKCQDIRETPWGKAKERYLWTYIFPDRVVSYELIKDEGEEPKDSDVVSRKSNDAHGLAGMPAVPVLCHVWAMQRLEDPTLKLFNRESALTWSLNQHAYPFLVVKRNNKSTQIIISDCSAVDLEQGDDLTYAEPGAQAFDAQFKDRDQCKRDMYEVFQAMAINALASQTQNARQAAEAKRIDKEPLSALLRMFYFGVKDALDRAGYLIAKYRDEDPASVKLIWPDSFDDKSVKEKLDELIQAKSIPGYPPTAIRAQLSDVAHQATAGASPEVKAAIDMEVAEAELDAPQPEPKTPATMTAAA